MLLGKEIFNFFTIYNLEGIISIFIFCFLLFLIVYRILNVRYKNNIYNYSDFLIYLTKKYTFINYKFFLFLINIFLIACFYIMIVALSTLFVSQFSIPKEITTIFVIILCYFIFNTKNIYFINNINTFLMPILILFIITLSFKYTNFTIINFSFTNNFGISLIKGILYFSYNSLLIIPILFNIKIKNKKSNLILSITFSIIILCLTFFTDVLLLTYYNLIKKIDLPILAICNLDKNLFSFIYFFVVLSAILTTLLSSGYSFILNISRNNKKIILIIFLLASFIFNYFSFSAIIDFFYPLFGFLGLLQIYLILNNKY